MALRELKDYVADLHAAYARAFVPFGFIERQARLQRRKDFHDAAIERLIGLATDPARARHVWERYGGHGLRLRDQRQTFKSQLVGAGLSTRAAMARIDVGYEEPTLETEVEK